MAGATYARRIAGDFDARVRSRLVGSRKRLDEGSGREVRELHRLDPKHAPTARMASVLDRLEQPCPDPDFSAFQKALGIEVTVARGPHVILLHQHRPAEASERIEILEKVITGFICSLPPTGSSCWPRARRLVSAWFAEKKDFLAFLHAEPPTHLRRREDIFIRPGARSLHSTRGALKAAQCEAKLAARRDELHRFGRQLEAAPARARIRIELGGEPVRTVGRSEAKAAIARVEGEITCETMLLDLDRRSIDLGTAAHEMIHQLAVESGLVPRHDAFPNWLHEGLAAQFEVIRGGRWSGISRAHDLRLPDWRKIQDPMPLERLVRDARLRPRISARPLRAGLGPGLLPANAAFARVSDVPRSSARPRFWRRQDRPRPARGDRVFRAFQRSFGSDLDALERDWRAFMATVKTPLEQNQPADRRKTCRKRVAERDTCVAKADVIDRPCRFAKIVTACIRGA